MNYVIFLKTKEGKYIEDDYRIFKNAEDCFREVDDLTATNEYDFEVFSLTTLMTYTIA